MGADSHVDYSYNLDVGEHGADVECSVDLYGSKVTSHDFVQAYGLMGVTSERAQQPRSVVRGDRDGIKACRGTVA